MTKLHLSWLNHLQSLTVPQQESAALISNPNSSSCIYWVFFMGTCDRLNNVCQKIWLSPNCWYLWHNLIWKVSLHHYYYKSPDEFILDLGLVLNPVTAIPIRERFVTHRHIEGGYMKNHVRTARIRAELPQPRALESSSSWERGQEQILFRAPRRSKPCKHLHFGLLASRNVSGYISVVLTPPGFWKFVVATLGDKYLIFMGPRKELCKFHQKILQISFKRFTELHSWSPLPLKECP